MRTMRSRGSPEPAPADPSARVAATGRLVALACPDGEGGSQGCHAMARLAVAGRLAGVCVAAGRRAGSGAAADAGGSRAGPLRTTGRPVPGPPGRRDPGELAPAALVAGARQRRRRRAIRTPAPARWPVHDPGGSLDPRRRGSHAPRHLRRRHRPALFLARPRHCLAGGPTRRRGRLPARERARCGTDGGLRAEPG